MHVVASNQQLEDVLMFMEDKVPILSHLITLLSCFKYGNFKGLLGQADICLPRDPESTKLPVLQQTCTKPEGEPATNLQLHCNKPKHSQPWLEE